MVKRLFKDSVKEHNVLDDRHEILNIYGSQCARCKHFMENDYFCLAYPEGIPDELLDGTDKHNSVRSDQKGNTLFEEVD